MNAAALVLDSGPRLRRLAPGESAELARLLDGLAYPNTDAPDLAPAAGGAFVSELLPGEVLFEPGEPVRSVVIVRSGMLLSAQLGPDGRPRRLRVLGPGAVLGEVEALAEAPLGARVSAVVGAQVFLLPRDAYACLLDANPAVRSHLLDLRRGRRAASLRAALSGRRPT